MYRQVQYDPFTNKTVRAPSLLLLVPMSGPERLFRFADGRHMLPILNILFRRTITMAFNKTPSAPAPAAVAVPGNWEKAKGFLNIYLPPKDGKTRRAGSVALRESKALENQILTFLEADEGNLTKLSSKLVIEYQSAAVNEGSMLDLA